MQIQQRKILKKTRVELDKTKQNAKGEKNFYEEDQVKRKRQLKYFFKKQEI